MGNKPLSPASQTPNKPEHHVAFQTSIDALNARVLNRDDLQLILACGKEIQHIRNPFIFIMSHKPQNSIAIDENCIQENITIINGTTHNDMNQKLSSSFKKRNDNKAFLKYDGIIVVLLAIVEICRSGDDIEIIRFYYDATQQKRHVEKMKKDFIYRMDEGFKFYMHYDATIINSVYTSKARPAAKFDYTSKVAEIKKNVKKKLIAEAHVIIGGYCRSQNQNIFVSYEQILQVIFRFYRDEPFVFPDTTVNDVLSDPELSMKIETSIADMGIMTDDAINSFARILNEHEEVKPSIAITSKNVNNKKNDENYQNKKETSKNDNEVKQHNDFTSPTSSFNGHSTPLCTIYENDENQQVQTINSFRVLQSAPNVSIHKSPTLSKQTCQNCASLQKLIFQIMKEKDLWQQQANVYFNELDIKENQIRELIQLNWLLINQCQLNTFQSTSLSPICTSTNGTLASSPHSKDHTDITHPMKNNANKDKAPNKKKRSEKSLTNQFSNYATFIPSQTTRAQGNIQIARQLTSKIPSLIKLNVPNSAICVGEPSIRYNSINQKYQNLYKNNPTQKIYISEQFMNALPGSIRQTFPDSLLKKYLKTKVAMQCNIEDDKTINKQAIHIGFCEEYKNQSVYAVLEPPVQGYTMWSLGNKLYNASDMRKKCSFTNLPVPRIDTETIRSCTIEIQNVLFKCPWQKIPILKTPTKITKTLMLSMDQRLFVESIKRFFQSQNTIDLIPITMFDQRHVYSIHYLLIVKIDQERNIDIGISLQMVDNKIEVTGIHLDKMYIKQQHLLTEPHHPCHCLKDFTSNINDLRLLCQDGIWFEKKYKTLKWEIKCFVEEFISVDILSKHWKSKATKLLSH